MKILDLKYPLIVAPMAGGPSSVELVSAASQAGALGSIGAAYMKPQEITEFVAKVREKTQNPIAINLFIPSKLTKISGESLEHAIRATEEFRKEFEIKRPELRPPFEEDFDQQFEAVLAAKPKVLSFIFGVLGPNYMKAAKAEGIYLIGTATNSKEAVLLADSGVDAVVAQGIDAGGHRGIFDPESEDPAIKTVDLIHQIRNKTKIPLIAAGGIMNPGHIREMLQAGAEAVQMGTAFLNVKEAGTSAIHRKKLNESTERKTKVTRSFSGRLARGIENRFMNEIDQNPESILPFPAQNKFTRDIRAASEAKGLPDCLSMWSGTGRGDLWAGSTEDFIKSLFR